MSASVWEEAESMEWVTERQNNKRPSKQSTGTRWKAQGANLRTAAKTHRGSAQSKIRGNARNPRVRPKGTGAGRSQGRGETKGKKFLIVSCSWGHGHGLHTNHKVWEINMDSSKLGWEVGWQQWWKHLSNANCYSAPRCTEAACVSSMHCSCDIRDFTCWNLKNGTNELIYKTEIKLQM